MSTILIKANKQNNKILAELAKRLGGNVIDVKDDEFEDLLLGRLIDSTKTGKTVSRSSIFKKLQSK